MIPRLLLIATVAALALGFFAGAAFAHILSLLETSLGLNGGEAWTLWAFGVAGLAVLAAWMVGWLALLRPVREAPDGLERVRGIERPGRG